MGILGSIATIIVGSLLTAVATIASVIAAVVAAIGAALLALGTIIWSSFVGIVLGSLEAFGVLSGWTAISIMEGVGALNAIGATVFLHTSSFVAALVAGVKTFLEVIHFKTLLQIHEIAMLVSEDYRLMMSKIFTQLGKFGHVISGQALFAIMALRNARIAVLDASTMLGRKYDIAEITWLHEMNGVLEKIQGKAQSYLADPYSLLTDIDDWLLRPAYNLKGGVVGGIFTLIEGTLDSVKAVIDDVTTLRDDLLTFVKDLPESIRKEILPRIEKITNVFDDFIKATYGPAVKKLDAVIATLTVKQDKTLIDLKDVVGRLARPGDYLLEIDGFGSEEKARQERIIGEVAARRFREDTESFKTAMEPVSYQLKKLRDLLAEAWTPVEWEVPESGKPLPLPQAAYPDKRTWYVGDY